MARILNKLMWCWYSAREYAKALQKTGESLNCHTFEYVHCYSTNVCVVDGWMNGVFSYCYMYMGRVGHEAPSV